MKYKDLFIDKLGYLKNYSIILFSLFIVFWYRNEPPLFIGEIHDYFAVLAKPIEYIFRYSTGLLGIIVSYFIVVKLAKINIVKSFLSAIGRKYTLDIYVLNIYFVSLINVENTNILIILLNVLVSLALSLIISVYIIRQSSLLSKLLLGGR